ncbi:MULTISPECIES: GyrI-like domain-containing protein [unclassified Clostridioides]|uniref:GyrI-like domain-containing protein n=1 Tax=unclassified Clostridioides TaxID=2635829 RepID=UPI001D11D3AE|nr:effector binding domain-containing protein [Clostridioides sp. ZZV14-6150]MCC0661377.1 effector binding domain-containing protein [Clostridioides sp. ZZV14-6154]MCC0723901.1 effector binding domain-containing protein [Clostridioides sp. ZZV14-6104]MCC0740268.1 effector binding domain-containing protein [Clostridioides sp. ZZV14-5902]MCC0744202.1 effector binding domain-containing protein [Clostridioides sp. ZZV14-6044]MCC0752256.1 effector binding domain-containing protein [Clostridioides s
MDYEIVHISEKIVVGVSKETTNNNGQAVKDIGELWKNFMGKGIYNAIKGKKNDKTIGLYTDYQGDFTNPYNFVACCEVNSEDGKDNNLSEFNEKDICGEFVISKVIPGGKYAKFTITGDIQKSVGEFWFEFWKMDFDRTYISDFEEYQNNTYDMNKQEVHIYIGIR